MIKNQVVGTFFVVVGGRGVLVRNSCVGDQGGDRDRDRDRDIIANIL